MSVRSQCVGVVRNWLGRGMCCDAGEAVVTAGSEFEVSGSVCGWTCLSVCERGEREVYVRQLNGFICIRAGGVFKNAEMVVELS